MIDYQIFISYRRDGGEDLAGRISDKLKGLGYRAFYDIESMRSGTFNTQIFDAIDCCEDVLLILPPNGLDRCKDPEDWVRLEIAHALSANKNIIPIMMRGFTFPAELPPDIDAIRYREGVTASTEYFDAVIGKIEKLLTSNRPSEEPPVPSADENFSAGERFLNYGLYPQALASFEKAMQTDLSNPDVYFYAAVALLGGKRPFLTPKPTVAKIEDYLSVASAIENKPIYRYFLAYVKYDFYHLKMLRTVPSYQELLMSARAGVSQDDSQSLFELLKAQKPDCF